MIGGVHLRFNDRVRVVGSVAYADGVRLEFGGAWVALQKQEAERLLLDLTAALHDLDDGPNRCVVCGDPSDGQWLCGKDTCRMAVGREYLAEQSADMRDER